MAFRCWALGLGLILGIEGEGLVGASHFGSFWARNIIRPWATAHVKRFGPIGNLDIFWALIDCLTSNPIELWLCASFLDQDRVRVKWSFYQK